MGSQQSHDIESQVQTFLLEDIKISSSILYTPEKDIFIQKFLKDTKQYNRTPDFIISDNLNEESIEKMFFIEVGEITGGILEEGQYYEKLDEYSVVLDKTHSYSRLLLNPPKLNINEAATNKLKKSYLKYSIERNNSINLGIILKIDDKLHRQYTYNGIDLVGGCYFIYTLALVKELSLNTLTYSKIFKKTSNLLKLNFSEKYKNLGFMIILGDGAMQGYSLCLINRRILNQKKHLIMKIIDYYKIFNS